MIELCDFSIGYAEKRLLDKVDASFKRGQLTALIGRNGTGKSTLLRAIAGLNHNYCGKILLDGHCIANMRTPEKARQLAFVTTERTRIANLRCEDVVAIGRAPYTNWIGRIDYEKNSQITLNKSGMFEAFYYAKKADGSYLRIVTPYLIQPYLNIINEGMYQKGYQLEFSDNLYLNDKKVYNGEILNLIGENKITHEVNHMKKDYIIYVEEKYYKQMDLNWIKSHIVQNLNDRYVYNILLSYDKEVKQVIVNDEIWPFNKVGKMIMLEFYSHKVGIEKYNIDYIEFMDGSIYTIQEQVCIKTKKSLPIIDIYYQEDFIQYNIVDDDQSINDILIKYYLNDKTVIVDRLHLENSKIKINSNVTKIEVVLQCENGTTDLYEQILFEIEAATKSKEKSFFNIDIQYSDNKINEILIKDFNVKNIDLLSAKIQDVIFTDALVDNRNKVVIYISFILTSIIVIVSTIILVIKKKS